MLKIENAKKLRLLKVENLKRLKWRSERVESLEWKTEKCWKIENEGVRMSRNWECWKIENEESNYRFFIWVKTWKYIRYPRRGWRKKIPKGFLTLVLNIKSLKMTLHFFCFQKFAFSQKRSLNQDSLSKSINLNP